MRIWSPFIPGVPGTFATVEERSVSGWDSGAVSIHVTNDDGGYEFYVPAGVVGAVCGLADNFAGIGYRSINHALMFSRGEFSLLEFGVTIETLGSYTGADKFVMSRRAGEVWVSKNGSIVARRQSTLAPAFRLASSLYLKGDEIVDAWPAAQNTGWGDSTLGAVTALGVQGPDSFGIGTLDGFSSNGGDFNRGVGDATLLGVRAVGTSRVYGAGDGSIGPISAYGEDGAFTPSWAAGTGYFGAFASRGHSVVGEVGTGAATLQGVQVTSADHPHAVGVGELGQVLAFGAQAVKISIGRLTHTGGYVVRGTGREAERTGFWGTTPALTMEGRGGGQWRLVGRPAVLRIEGVVPGVLRGEMPLPRPSLSARGLVGSIGGGALRLAGRLGLIGRGGGGGAMTLSGRYKVEAAGATGAAGKATLHFVGRYVLVAEGRARQATVWSLSAPALQVVPSGQAWLVAPAITMVAAGGEIVEASYEAYSINLATGAVTRYTDFAFDNVLRFGDKFFGIRADGVYELAGDTDDGAPIVAQVRTFNTNFGATNIKRVPFMYVSGQVGTDLSVGFVADKGVEYKYPVGLVREQGVRTGRAKAGLGVKGSYYNFSITNEDGQDFQIDRLEAIVDATTVVKA